MVAMCAGCNNIHQGVKNIQLYHNARKSKTILSQFIPSVGVKAQFKALLSVSVLLLV